MIYLMTDTYTTLRAGMVAGTFKPNHTVKVEASGQSGIGRIFQLRAGLTDDDYNIIVGGSSAWIRDRPDRVDVDENLMRRYSGVLVDGNAIRVGIDQDKPATVVWWDPAAGDTIRIRYKVDEDSPWFVKGTYTQEGADQLVSSAISGASVWALEFQRTAGSGTTSAFGVK